MTGVDIGIIEQEMDFEAGILALTKRFPTGLLTGACIMFF